MTVVTIKITSPWTIEVDQTADLMYNIRNESEDNMHYFVYLTENNINHKRYIGAHLTDDIDDGYIGSGTALRNAIARYGKEQFTVLQRMFVDSKEEMYELEALAVDNTIVSDPMYYNIKPGGEGGSGPHTSESIIKMRSRAQLHPALSCPHCDATSHSPGSFKKHHYDNCVHSPTFTPYICKYCDSTILRELTYKRYHGDNCKQHPDYAPSWITCPHCDKQSVSRSNMDRYHMDNCRQRPD